MANPRERISTGEYLTRLYVHLSEIVHPDSNTVLDGNAGVKAGDARQRRSKTTQERISQQAADAMKPYILHSCEGWGG